MKNQDAILQPISPHARFLEFSISDTSAISNAISYLNLLPVSLNGDFEVIVGLGMPLTDLLDLSIPGFSAFPKFRVV